MSKIRKLLIEHNYPLEFMLGVEQIKTKWEKNITKV